MSADQLLVVLFGLILQLLSIFLQGISQALQMLYLSPHFLYLFHFLFLLPCLLLSYDLLVDTSHTYIWLCFFEEGRCERLIVG